MKPTKKSLSRNKGTLDKLWRTAGKESARCEICETLPSDERVAYTQLHPHHIIKRGHKATRWDLRNRLWVCPTHHTLGPWNKSVESNTGGWFWGADDDWLGTHRPSDKKYLEGKKYETKKWEFDELMEIHDTLKEEAFDLKETEV